MKNLLAFATLIAIASLCNLTEKFTERSRQQDNSQTVSNQNSGESNSSATPGPTDVPPAPSAASNQNGARGNSAGAISGGELNDKATSLPKPAYPAVAKAARASGEVVVQVTVDETGKVISANAVSGHPLLRQAAIQAAYQARFAPTKVNGKPVKVTGTITYDFQL